MLAIANTVQAPNFIDQRRFNAWARTQTRRLTFNALFPLLKLLLLDLGSKPDRLAKRGHSAKACKAWTLSKGFRVFWRGPMTFHLDLKPLDWKALEGTSAACLWKVCGIRLTSRTTLMWLWAERKPGLSLFCTQKIPMVGLWMEQSVCLVRTLWHSCHSALTYVATVSAHNNICYI